MENEKKFFVSNNNQETETIAAMILRELPEDCNLILLEGDLGAGKTTFSQFVLENLGAEGPFTSPTFVIMKEYNLEKSQNTNSKFQTNPKSQITNYKHKKNSKFDCVYHIDCYRIESEEEILDLGWEEIIANKSNLILIEWPERIKNILPEKYVKIILKIIGKEKRKLEVIKK
ncbi:MAG: tRNA (adenosine(37)-N6)-threonylcarbamoyltransferase complex ATPase subunit type 1 TsaE [Candidatus Moraniibacteriota bacterium]